MATWWCSIEDILWPDKKVIDKIKRRAEGFANAGIDTAINFGFHTRFDFSDYFGSVHGYLAAVSNELHKYGIKYMDHFSCNLVERPRGGSDFSKVRHHILLHPDPIAAEHAQYAGYMYKDLFEVDIRDGSRGYNWVYQTELFCHNNTDYLDMHKRYMERLIREVPMDGIEVDDMCDYGGLSTCSCSYCRERFRRDYGHELPPFEDKSFYGDTTKMPYYWGNYENPILRDWLRMKADSVADHVKMVKEAIGDLPLMTCCSGTGPMVLNTVSLNLERMMGHLDLVMLENGGITTDKVNWIVKDAEALQQKDIAEKMGNAPAIALGYTIMGIGGYLGWSLARFWGTANWCSTLASYLEGNPKTLIEDYEIIGSYNKWEIEHSNLDYNEGNDVAEVRLVCNRLCKENGWRNEEGREHWDMVHDWALELLKNNIGYRFVRADELADVALLKAVYTPLILDSIACLSDIQFIAINEYLAQGGRAWIRLPFGTHDEKGFRRKNSLSEVLLNKEYEGLTITDEALGAKMLSTFIASGKVKPRIKQLSGYQGWAARLRVHSDGVMLHLMNRSMEGVPHPTLKEEGGSNILLDVLSTSENGLTEFLIDFDGLGSTWDSADAISPEIGSEKRIVTIQKLSDTQVKVAFDLTGIKVYCVVQPSGIKKK